MSKAATTQVSLGRVASQTAETSVEERNRQWGCDSKPAPGRVRDEREFIPEGRGAVRGSGWTHTEKNEKRPAYSRRSEGSQ